LCILQCLPISSDQERSQIPCVLAVVAKTPNNIEQLHSEGSLEVGAFLKLE